MLSIGSPTPAFSQAMETSKNLAQRKKELAEEEKLRKQQLYMQLAQLSLQGINTAGSAASGGASIGLW